MSTVMQNENSKGAKWFSKQSYAEKLKKAINAEVPVSLLIRILTAIELDNLENAKEGKHIRVLGLGDLKPKHYVAKTKGRKKTTAVRYSFYPTLNTRYKIYPLIKSNEIAVRYEDEYNPQHQLKTAHHPQEL